MSDADLIEAARLEMARYWMGQSSQHQLAAKLDAAFKALEERGAQLERAREAPNGFIAQLKEAIQRENAWRHRALAAESLAQRQAGEIEGLRAAIRVAVQFGSYGPKPTTVEEQDKIIENGVAYALSTLAPARSPGEKEKE